jgi:anti-sigma factor RsiW
MTIKRVLAMMGMMLGWIVGIRMHRCKAVVQLLDDYVEGELPPNERRSLDLHLAACPNCKNFADSYRATRDLARELRYGDIPPEFRERLHAVLEKRLGDG